MDNTNALPVRNLEELGAEIKAAREGKNLSIEDVAVATCIRRNFLEDIEKGDFSKFKARVYARGFVHTYLDFLGENALWDEYSQLLTDAVLSPERTEVPRQTYPRGGRRVSMQPPASTVAPTHGYRFSSLRRICITLICAILVIAIAGLIGNWDRIHEEITRIQSRRAYDGMVNVEVEKAQHEQKKKAEEEAVARAREAQAKAEAEAKIAAEKEAAEKAAAEARAAAEKAIAEAKAAAEKAAAEKVAAAEKAAAEKVEAEAKIAAEKAAAEAKAAAEKAAAEAEKAVEAVAEKTAAESEKVAAATISGIESSAEAARAAATTAPVETPAEAPAAEPAKPGLTMRASGECWLQVNRGKEILISTTVDDGWEATYEFDGPLMVRLGNAQVISLSTDGENFTQLTGAVVRYEIRPDGTMRRVIRKSE